MAAQSIDLEVMLSGLQLEAPGALVDPYNIGFEITSGMNRQLERLALRFRHCLKEDHMDLNDFIDQIKAVSAIRQRLSSLIHNNVQLEVAPKKGEPLTAENIPAINLSLDEFVILKGFGTEWDPALGDGTRIRDGLWCRIDDIYMSLRAIAHKLLLYPYSYKFTYPDVILSILKDVYQCWKAIHALLSVNLMTVKS